MKKATPILSLASLFFLVSAFVATTTAEIVYDSNGDFMLNGGTYILSPTPHIGAGEIIAAAIRHKDSDTCSLAVVESEPYTTHGWPVTISALVLPTFISTTYPLQLSFAYVPPNICTNNSNWIIKSSNDFEGNLEAVMVSDSDNPVGSLFYIKPYESSSAKYTYKLVVCSGEDLGVCKNIGVQNDNNGYKRLVLTNNGEPLVLHFAPIIRGGVIDLKE